MKKFTDKRFYLGRKVREVCTMKYSIAEFLDKIRRRTRSQNFSDSPYAPYTVVVCSSTKKEEKSVNIVPNRICPRTCDGLTLCPEPPTPEPLTPLNSLLYSGCHAGRLAAPSTK